MNQFLIGQAHEQAPIGRKTICLCFLVILIIEPHHTLGFMATHKYGCFQVEYLPPYCHSPANAATSRSLGPSTTWSEKGTMVQNTPVAPLTHPLTNEFYIVSQHKA